jgi:hypothetical protein
VELTGYKEVWIGATPPTKAHRQMRDRRILVDDLWFDVSTRSWKRCSSTSPPTWDDIETFASKGAQSVPGDVTNVTITIDPGDADYTPVLTPSWNTTCWVPTVSKLSGSFVVWFSNPPSSTETLYNTIRR